MSDKNINQETGEFEDVSIVPYETPQNMPEFYGLSQKRFTEEQQKILNQDIPPQDVEIDPQGLIYLPQIKYRRILNTAFGPGAWGIRPHGEIKIQNNVVMFPGELWAEGRFIAWAIGEQRYIESNERMSYASAIEAAKSDCITRCCKDLGVASCLWDPNFILKWKKDFAIKVFVENQKTKKNNVMWRRKDRDSFSYPWKETGIAEGTLEEDNSVIDKWEQETKDATTQRRKEKSVTPKTISEAQHKRLFAIANGVGMKQDTIKGIVAAYGFEHSNEITVDSYDKIISEIESWRQ